MYTGLYHTHKLAVLLFLAIYVIKLILLLSRKERLEKFTKVVKVPEMIVSFAFLATGIYLLINTAAMSTMLWAKLAFVFASIPMAIIGFKNSKKPLAVVSVVFIILAYGMAEMNKGSKAKKKELESSIIIDANQEGYEITSHGKALFLSQCALCHGESGDMKLSGAKDLTITKLTEEGIITIITEGKNTMPGYGKIYTEDEIMALVNYISILKGV